MQAIDYKNQGNEALAAGDAMKAIKCYTQAIELDSTDHVYYSNRSAAYLSSKQYENALNDANQCIKLKPEWGKGYARKAAIYHTQKQYQEAINAYEEGLRNDPTNVTCKNGLEEIQRIQAEGASGAGASGAAGANPGNPLAGLFGPDMFGKIATNPKLSPLLADAEFVKKLQEIQSDPTKLNMHLSDHRIMTVLSEFMGLNLGDMSQMPTTPKDASSANPSAAPTTTSPLKKTKTSSSPFPKETEEPVEETLTEEEKQEKKMQKESEEMKLKGNAHYKKREFTEALECYKQACSMDPTNMSYLSNMAAVYLELKQYDECIKKCHESIKIGREQRADYALIAKSYTRIGNAYVKQSENTNVELLQKAIKSYEDALVENRTKPLELKLKTTVQSLKKAEELAYIDPAKGLEAKTKGNDFFKAGDFPKAVEMYTEAIKRDPENPVYFANRAAALTKLTSFVDAKQDCEKSLALDPSYVKAYSRKGAIEFFMKEYHKSMESYKKGLSIDPENEECKIGLNRVVYAIQTSNTEEVNKERAEHAMADPEIQMILRDPVMQTVLQDMQQNPQSAAKHMSNPEIMKKIEKLIASGVLQTK